MEPKDKKPFAAQRVERTSIAHEGERIFPADDSVAPLDTLPAAAVNYYFPVEIEVVGGKMDAMAEQIFDALRLHIEALG